MKNFIFVHKNGSGACTVLISYYTTWIYSLLMIENCWTFQHSLTAVDSTALSFKRVDNILSGNDLLSSVLDVCGGLWICCDSIPDHALHKHFENTSGFFVDQTGDPFDTTSSCQTLDRGFGDSLDVIAPSA